MIEAITLTEFSKIINLLFDGETRVEYTAEFLIGLSKKKGLSVKISNIDQWEEFETGNVDFDASKFGDLVIASSHRLFRHIFLLSDESLKIETAFKFQEENFDQFVDFYEDLLNQEFFQAIDYFVFFEGSNQLKIVHHDGHIVEIN